MNHGVLVIAQKNAKFCQVFICLPGNLFSVEVIDHIHLFSLISSAVSKRRRVLLIQRFDISIGNDVIIFSQLNQFLIVLENRIRILQLCFRINVAVVLCDLDPRIACGKSAFLVSSHCIGVRLLSLE